MTNLPTVSRSQKKERTRSLQQQQKKRDGGVKNQSIVTTFKQYLIVKYQHTTYNVQQPPSNKTAKEQEEACWPAGSTKPTHAQAESRSTYHRVETATIDNGRTRPKKHAKVSPPPIIIIMPPSPSSTSASSDLSLQLSKQSTTTTTTTTTTTNPQPVQPSESSVSPSSLSSSSSTEGFFSRCCSRISGSIFKISSARVSPKGCRFIGYMRIAFALICIVDRLMLYPDYELFFHPHHGMLRLVNVNNVDNDNNTINVVDDNTTTCSATSHDGTCSSSSYDSTPTIMTPTKMATFLLQQLQQRLHFFTNNNMPDDLQNINLLSRMQYTTTMDQRWWLFWFGFVNILLVLVGICPRLNLLLWHINYCSIMYNSSDYIADGTETGIVPLTKLMDFYFMLLPLDNITIYDGFGGLLCRKKKKKNQSNNPGRHRRQREEQRRQYQKDENTTNDYNEMNNQIVVGDNNKNETAVVETLATTTSAMTTTCWPMWPVFLVQWQTVLIMVGAGLAKWTGADEAHPISSSHWVDGTSMYYIMFGCPDECTGLIKYPDFIFDRVIVVKLMTWSALFVETVGPCLIWFRTTRIPCFVALVVLHISIDLTMSMHTFQPLMVLMWCSFLINPIHQTSEDELSSSSSTTATTQTKTRSTTKTNILHSDLAVTPKWRQLIDLMIYFAMLFMIFSMSFPTNEIIPILESYNFSWRFQYYNLVHWHNGMVDNYLSPFTQLLGIYQGPWCLFSGYYEGISQAMEVNAATANGTAIFGYWTTPDWANLPRLEHKLMFNHINVYKHLSDCNGCDEQITLMLSLVREILESSNPYDIVRLNLYNMQIYPPQLSKDWDNGLSWFDPIRQPLEYAEVGFELGVVICHDEVDNGCDDKEERFKFYFNEKSLVPFMRWKTKKGRQPSMGG